MNNVTADYQGNRRSVDELDKDYETQKKKMQSSNQSREARLEQNYKEDIEKTNSQAKATVDNVREQFDHYHKNQTDDVKNLRDEFAKQSYDRQGRLLADLKEKDMVSRTAQNAADARVTALEEKQKKFEDYSQNRSGIREQENLKQLEKVQNNYREDANTNSLTGRVAKAKSDEMHRQKVSSDADRAIEQARADSAETAHLGQAIAKDYEERLKNTKDKYSTDADRRTERVQQTYEDKISESATAEEKSRSKENEQLRKQVKNFSNENREVASAKNEARAEAINDVENSYRYQLDNQQHTSELEQKKLKNQIGSGETALNEKFDDALREKGAKNAAAIRQINLDYNENLKTLKKDFDTAMTDYKGSNSHQNGTLEKVYGTQRDALHESHEKALMKQQEAFQNALHDNRNATMSDTKRLESEIRELKTTSDSGKVSAGVENSIREGLEKKYSKSADIETKRNTENTQRVHDEYQDRYRDLLTDKQRTVAQVRREVTTDKMALEHTLMDQLDDSEYAKREALRSASEREQSSVEKTQKVLSRDLVNQKSHFEDTLAVRDVRGEQRIKETLLDTDFEKRQMRREFQTQMNLKIREYEKKLTNQKEDYEALLHVTKETGGSVTRDTEKRLTQTLSEQARGYERRIAELESSNKQREKLQEKIYEDELDKVKRSNALLLSKKS